MTVKLFSNEIDRLYHEGCNLTIERNKLEEELQQYKEGGKFSVRLSNLKTFDNLPDDALPNEKVKKGE